MDALTEIEEPIPKVQRNTWIKILFNAIVLYFVLLMEVVLMRNSNIFPALSMVGSFMIPVAYVAFIYERRSLSLLTMPTILLAFVYGGLFAIATASLLEPTFISQLNIVSILIIGFIEEFAKILGVLVISRHRRHDSGMDGLILGAAVGMGFAAMESNGYAFTTFLQSHGSISTTVIENLVRGVLSPLGHGTWTAFLAFILFRESENGYFVINLKVIGAYLIVSFLHSMWNWLAMVISDNLSMSFGVLIAYVIISITGLGALWLCWKEAVRLQMGLPPETEDICT